MKLVFSEKTINRQTIFEGKVFTVHLDTVELCDGKTAHRELVRHNGGACMVAIDENQMTYLVGQYRKPFEQMLLEIPAGKLEPGEDPMACAARELTEETGYIAHRIIPLGKMYPTPGYCGEILYLYLGMDLEKSVASPDEGEHLIVQSMPFTEALAMVDRGELPDAKTQMALLKTQRYLATINGNQESDDMKGIANAGQDKP
jgi:ADP-ribose pyrophosphatase